MDEGIKHRILIIGDGDKYEELKQKAKAHQLTNPLFYWAIKTIPFLILNLQMPLFCRRKAKLIRFQ